MNRIFRIFLLAFLIGLLIPLVATRATPAKDEWLPITPEELALKDNPASPGAHAMILYRESIIDDVESLMVDYRRIKIFTDEGKKYANVEIPFEKGVSSVKEIRARTVRPDGSIVNFNDQVFEKLVVRLKGVKALVKTFTLPEVQPGCIIEYRSKLQLDREQLHSIRWIIPEELFTRRTHFAFRPWKGPGTLWRSFGLSKEQSPQMQKDGTYQMTVVNVPAFQEEEFMPPEIELKSRVEFTYTRQSEEKSDDFWKRTGKEWAEKTEGFMNKRGVMEQELARLVSPSDPPEMKLRKLYARVQQIHNLSFEREKTEKEERREKVKENNNVEDVLKRGYGTGLDINLLFVALARAAGFQADIALVASRNEQIFHPELEDIDELNARLALVHVGSQDNYYDPATRFCPFGHVPWEETAVRGVRVTKKGGILITTSSPHSEEAVLERRASLRLDPDGSLSGKLQMIFGGQWGLSRRLEAREEDEAGRRKKMEEDIKALLPPNVRFELTNVTGWDNGEEPLRAEGTVRIPGLGVVAGRRILLPLGIFEVNGRQPFQHAKRVNDIDFHFPYQELDDVSVQLPEGYRVESLPEPQKYSAGGVTYEITSTQQEHVIQFTRRLTIEGTYYQAYSYPDLRTFFNNARAADEQQAVLQSAESAHRN